ncbi:MAG: peptidase M50 [uncultured bacterium]|nr:MAG: peptidase M50 [uncultured bacterium]
MTIALIIILLISVIVHEISHGLMALVLGDKTAKNQGRLTLNPIKHIDLFGTILMPAILSIMSKMSGGAVPVFGYAKPVPVNLNNLKYKRLGMALVAICGPLSNLILALIAAIILIKFKLFQSIYTEFLINVIQINILLIVFNIIPIPPLDGSRIVSWLLPKELAIQYDKLENYGFIILIFILQTNLISWMYVKSGKLFIQIIDGFFN